MKHIFLTGEDIHEESEIIDKFTSSSGKLLPIKELRTPLYYLGSYRKGDKFIIKDKPYKIIDVINDLYVEEVLILLKEN